VHEDDARVDIRAADFCSSLALPILFMPLSFLLLLAALAANNNQKASGVKRVGNASLLLELLSPSISFLF